MNTMKNLLSVLILTLPLLASSCAEEKKEGELSLMAEDWQWSAELKDVEHVPAAKTAIYEADGKTLTVGPWIAGKRDIRLAYQRSLPVKEGTVCGRFRTENLYPREANIWITYKKGRKTITELNYWLGVADEWTDFCFPVFEPFEDCDSIVLSFGFHMKTHGRVHLADLCFGEPHALPALETPAPELTRSVTPAPFAPADKVRLEQSEDGTWWLVDTDGKPFFAKACAMYNNRLTPEESYPTLEKLHFNTIANGSNLQEWCEFNEKQRAEGKPTVFQFYRVNTDISARSPYVGLMNPKEAASNADPDAGMAEIGGFNHAFPDPFDPNWETDARRQVREVAATFKDKPYFMVWMAANERSHWNLYRYVWSPYCAVEFGKYLQDKYATITDLNHSWGTDFPSFEELLKQRPEPEVIEGNKYEDFNAFSRIILKTFNQKVLSIIHEEDPGRLVFTNRFMIHEVRGVFDNLDLYEGFDGVAVNIYPSNDVWGLDLAERQYLTLMHEKTGKPLMICEWSVPARDSHLYDNPKKLDWSYPQIMRTQIERAQQVARVSADFYNMPFVVGAHWFSWGDFNHRTRQSNRGIFHNDGVTPWQEVQDALGEVNGRMK